MQNKYPYNNNFYHMTSRLGVNKAMHKNLSTTIYIGIKHVFLCINICWTPRVVLKPKPERRGLNDPRGVLQMLVYQKTLFDRYYCIKSFCHLKTLEKSFKRSFLYYKNGAQKHEGFVGFEKPVPKQRLTSS